MTIASDKASTDNIGTKSSLKTLDWSRAVTILRQYTGIQTRSTTLSDYSLVTYEPISGVPVNTYDWKTGPKATPTDMVCTIPQMVVEALHEFIEIIRYYNEKGDYPSHTKWAEGQFHDGSAVQGTSPGIGKTNDLKSQYYATFLNVLWQMWTTNKITDITHVKDFTNAFGDGSAYAITDTNVERVGVGNPNMADLMIRLAYFVGLLVKGIANPKSGVLLQVYLDPKKNVTIDNLRERTFYKLANRVFYATLIWFCTDVAQYAAAQLNITALGEDEIAGLAKALGYDGAEALGVNADLKFLFRNNTYDHGSPLVGIPQLYQTTSLTTTVTKAFLDIWTNLSFKQWNLFSDVSKATYGISIVKGRSLISQILWGCDGFNNADTGTAGPDDVGGYINMVIHIFRRFVRPAGDEMMALEGLNVNKDVKTYVDPVLAACDLKEMKLTSFQGFSSFKDLKFYIQKILMPLTATTRSSGYINGTDSIFYSAVTHYSLTDSSNTPHLLRWLNEWGLNPDYVLRIIGDDQIDPLMVVVLLSKLLKYNTAIAGNDGTVEEIAGLGRSYNMNTDGTSNLKALAYRSGANYTIEVGIDNQDLDADFELPDVQAEAKNASYSAEYTVEKETDEDIDAIRRGFVDTFVDTKGEQPGYKDWKFDINPGNSHRMLSKWVKDLYYNASPSLGEFITE